MERRGRGHSEGQRTCVYGLRAYLLRPILLITHQILYSALKLRYMLPLVSSSQLNGTSSQSNTPLPSPSVATITFHQFAPPTLFDAPTIAKREEHWEDMLEAALFKWVEAFVNEKRAE
jgi:hypothetical protein